MEFISSGAHTVLSFILILSVIVFIHEFGHYFVAKCCGVKIETFSIGFGKELFGFNDRSGTRWKFSMLPLGGYVKMFGDQGPASTADDDLIAQMNEDEQKVSFHFKPLWQKALVVAAGPIANFILTISILTWFLYTTGIASTEPIVGEIMPDTPAQEAGLMSGDRIVRVDGKEVQKFSDIPNLIMTNLGEPVRLDIIRNNEELALDITPMEYDDVDALGNPIKRPLIGFRSQQLTVQDLSFPQAVWQATAKTYDLCVVSLRFMGQMVVGKRSADDLKGPIGIAKLSGQVTQSGDTVSETARMILWFIAMLSANLGLINLLPIPLLDGGHLVYYAIEGARGKPMAQKFQELGFRIGFTLIAMLMAFTLFNDIKQIIL